MPTHLESYVSSCVLQQILNKYRILKIKDEISFKKH
jgi:hypothetical protein